VSTEVASGLFALGGALIGGFASWLATATEARNRRKDLGRQRREAIADLRRQLYADLVKRADLLGDSIRDVSSFDAPADVPADNHARYLNAWEQFVEATAAVELIGPSSVSNACRSLHRAHADLCNQIDSWMRGGNWTAQDTSTYEANQATKSARRAEFLALAQAAVHDGE
jgi:hypothetical protein